MDKRDHINIGIITPRAYEFDGFNEDSSQRINYRNILEYLGKYYSENFQIKLLTQLNSGGGIDTITVASKNKWPLDVYLSCNNSVFNIAHWSEKFNENTDNFDTIKYFKGKYLSKKYIETNKQIVGESDVVIYVMNSLKYKCSILNFAFSTNKPLYLLRV